MSRRHWFATSNDGMPYNQNTRDRVLNEVNGIGAFNVEMKLHITVHDKDGAVEIHQGTRSEIDRWFRERRRPVNLAATVTTEAGITVGKKLFGRKTIVWGVRSSE
jgi:hypothetical protein